MRYEMQLLNRQTKAMKNIPTKVEPADGFRQNILDAPTRGTKLLNLIESALADMHGRKLSYVELGEIAGQSSATLFNWSNGSNLRQADALLRLLECLPESKRTELVNRISRQLPTLQHRRISWRDRQVSGCEQLLQEQAGISLIVGDENARDFLVTALGHSLASLRPPSPVWGIDVRVPDYFVPVNGVAYLGCGCNPKDLNSLFEAAWPTSRSVKRGTIFLNGVANALNQRPLDVQELASRAHVIIADKAPPTAAQITLQKIKPFRSVLVKEEKDRRITIEFLE